MTQYDCLFDYVATCHGEKPWGRILDAGTGAHSLAWLASLETESLTAVTGDPAERDRLAKRIGLRDGDRIIHGNWTDDALLVGESFDVVVADYLLGAVEGFAPYFQTDLFRRLRPHVARDLYAVGLEPYEMFPDDAAGVIVKRIARLRDACILAGGGRCYREYPRRWTIARLEEAGYEIASARSFPITYGPKFIKQQIAVGARYVPHVGSKTFARGLRLRLAQVEREALKFAKRNGGLRFGEDWVIHARVALPE